MARTATGEGPVLLLRTEEFLRHCTEEAGLRNRADIARHLGVSRPNVTRLLDGANRPGTALIARTLAAFPEAKFEDLFEVKLAA